MTLSLVQDSPSPRERKKNRLSLNGVICCCLAALFVSTTTVISTCLPKTNHTRQPYYVIDGRRAGPEFDGHGGLSAGGSSRLLVDYPEPQRSEILDYLFLPGFGASLSVLKIEIGGDAQSTVGTEPSHMHARGDLGCDRGYEGWLAREARKRNPDIKLWSLSWGIPGWIGNATYYSDENIDYQIAWLECLRDHHGVMSDYLGLWNERPQGSTDYVVKLRKELDKRGFPNVGITIEATWQRLIDNVLTDPLFNQSVAAATKHYPCNSTSDAALQANKKFWAGEDSPTPYSNWTAASCWGRKLNQHFLKMQATSVVAWAVVWSALPGVSGPPQGDNHQFLGNAFLTATEPWSGHYTVPPAVWINAHWGQFVKPGWRYLKTNGGSGFLAGGGSYVTLVPPDEEKSPRTLPNNTFTMIVETLQGDCEKGCNVVAFNETQTLSFHLQGDLDTQSTTRLNLWCSNSTNVFERQLPIFVDEHGVFQLTMRPDTICSVTTLNNGAKGQYPQPPPSKPFPTQYYDDFSLTGEDKLPWGFTDVYGSFAVRDNSLTQVSTSEPTGWAPMNLDPLTFFGDIGWTDVHVSLSAFVNHTASHHYVRVCGGCSDVGYSRIKFACPPSCCFNLSWTGEWTVGSAASGKIANFSGDEWHHIILTGKIGLLKASVDGEDIVETADSTCQDAGMVGLGCGAYHMCAFRNFRVGAQNVVATTQTITRDKV